MRKSLPLWDLPTRVFHWLLVICIALSWWTGEEALFERHAWVGYTVLVLVVFRLVWGFAGSRHSRFSDFLVGPKSILRYLRGEGSGSPGHNPLGGWSVVVMLVLVLVQAVSGLFNSDDVLFNGPLYYGAGVAFRDAMGVVHEWAFDVLVVFIALHVAAVLWHQFGRRERILQAMWRGSAAGKEGTGPAAPWWLAVLLVIILVLLLWVVITNAPQPVSMW
jgi:cytochrome b